MQESTKEQLYEGIYKTIREVLPSDVEILHISLTGSRSKGLESPTSDYDVRVLILNPTESYLLSTFISHIKIKITYGGKDLEGQAWDFYHQFLNLVIEGNEAIIHILKSEYVYTKSKELMQAIWDIYEKCYEPSKVIQASYGLLIHYLKKHLKDPNELHDLRVSKDRKKDEKLEVKKVRYLEAAPVKFVVECLYHVLQLRAMLAGKTLLQYFTMEDLMVFAGEDEQMIRELVAIRKANKSQLILVTERIKSLLIEGESLPINKILKDGEVKFKELQPIREEMRKKADELFLNMIKK